MKRSPLLVTAAAVLSAPTLAAQATLGIDLSYNSGYVMRGISFTSRPVAQGAATLTVPAAGFTFSGGAWANLEAARYTASRDISMTAGENGPNLTEVDGWADVSRQLGPAAVTLGALRMTYPNEEVFTSSFNTTEVYARVGLPNVPLAPRVAVNYDVDKVLGAYVEGAVGQSLKLGRVPLSLGAAAGWSSGEALREGSSELYYFAGEGFTHVDLSASTSVQAGPLRISPVAHVVVGRDEIVRTVHPGEGRDVKGWVGLTASWSTPLRK